MTTPRFLDLMTRDAYGDTSQCGEVRREVLEDVSALTAAWLANATAEIRAVEDDLPEDAKLGLRMALLTLESGAVLGWEPPVPTGRGGQQ